MHIPLVKNNVFLPMHYSMLATLFNHFVPVCTCETFDFDRYDTGMICFGNFYQGNIPRLKRKKRSGEGCIFS